MQYLRLRKTKQYCLLPPLPTGMVVIIRNGLPFSLVTSLVFVSNHVYPQLAIAVKGCTQT